MLVTVLKKMIERGLLEGLQEKIDVFYAVGRITDEEYMELVLMVVPQ